MKLLDTVSLDVIEIIGLHIAGSIFERVKHRSVIDCRWNGASDLLADRTTDRLTVHKSAWVNLDLLLS